AGGERTVLWRGGRLVLRVVDDRDRRRDGCLLGDESGEALAVFGARHTAVAPPATVLAAAGGVAADDPGVLRSAALARVDDQLTLRQGDAREAARQHPHLVSVVDGERPQVGVTRAHPV